MKKCCVCDNDAGYIDSMDNYMCEDCVNNDIDGNYSDQTSEDFEKLNWKKYPENGYCE